MNNNECQFEREIMQAVKSGAWNEQLQHHVETCHLCSETLLVTRSMLTIQEEALQHAPAIPAYRLLWLKAQFTQRQEHLSKLDLVSLIGLSLVCSFASLGLLFWKFPQLHGRNFGRLLESPSGWINMFPLSIPVAIVIVFMISIWVYSLEFYFTKRT